MVWACRLRHCAVISRDSSAALPGAATTPTASVPGVWTAESGDYKAINCCCRYVSTRTEEVN